MKTLGRIMIILTVFAMLTGITYVAVNAGSSSTSANPPAFEQGGENLRSQSGERPEFDGEGSRGDGWMFGLSKNIGILAVIVTLIVAPKNLMRSRAVPVRVK
jgi:hypothetical protein